MDSRAQRAAAGGEVVSPGPYEEVQREIAELRAERERLHGLLRDVEAKLAKCRIKCPMCRCKILPDEACGCCTDARPERWHR